MDPYHRILKQVMIDGENSSELDVTFTTLMGDKAVSYTHLDVYKRQVILSWGKAILRGR